MEKPLVELPGHDDGVPWEMVEEGRPPAYLARVRDLKHPAAPEGKSCDGIFGGVGGAPFLVDFYTVLLVQEVSVELHVEGFVVVASRVSDVIPFRLCRFELAHQIIIHLFRVCVVVGMDPKLLMAILPATDSAGACQWRDLQGIVDPMPSPFTSAPRNDLDAPAVSTGLHLFLHRLPD